MDKSYSKEKEGLSYQKTVYVLGAGFSYDGGFPLQSHILNRILDSSVHAEDIIATTDRFFLSKEPLKQFLDKVFHFSKNPSLEDVFTLLDQTIARREYCLGYSWSDLDQIRDTLKRAILTTLHFSLDNLKDKQKLFYEKLGLHFIFRRLKDKIDKQTFSIISLNWDPLVEESIYWNIANLKSERLVDVDFCCFSNPFGENSRHTASILQKSKGIYNIKILKLHGSTNWLLCPNCNRLYTGIGSETDIWNLYCASQECPHCIKKLNIAEDDKKPILEPFLITPTFTKVFDNNHIQMIWHNAHVELSEADKIVFIGYSLPEADYHFRTLLRRAVNQNVSIEVVLTSKDKITPDIPERMRQYLPPSRYTDFFGKDRVRFYWSGIHGYFKQIINEKDHEKRLKYLRRRMAMLKKERC
ncbi:MAG: hypothetical protein MRK02_00175 [Candidatus Scalindua sp.]|nr:hypothetical protein [Candidatus Scalindua sp.]